MLIQHSFDLTKNLNISLNTFNLSKIGHFKLKIVKTKYIQELPYWNQVFSRIIK